ncbi:hypothetical protein [Streptomyces albidoflavus]|uniref:hypothetical protein n=1 Tax=Streptomyces albidoflavus TaxID=1886 RepID=UPI0033C5442E
MGAGAGFATGTGATARWTGGVAGEDPGAARGVVPAGGLASGAPIGERRRAGAGLGREGRPAAGAETGVSAGAGGGTGEGAGAGAADGACELLATGSEATGLEETGAPRPERARWTGGADDE